MQIKSPETKVERLAIGIASGLTTRGAALKAEVPESTARKWITDQSFNDKIKSYRDQMLSRALGILVAGAATAAKALVEEARKPTDTSDARVRAAKAVLDALSNANIQPELKAEIAALRDEVAKTSGRST